MLLITCAATIMINLSNIPWNAKDEQVKNRADQVCRIEYKSCLKKFIKKEERTYNAICGN